MDPMGFCILIAYQWVSREGGRHCNMNGGIFVNQILVLKMSGENQESEWRCFLKLVSGTSNIDLFTWDACKFSDEVHVYNL